MTVLFAIGFPMQYFTNITLLKISEISYYGSFLRRCEDDREKKTHMKLAQQRTFQFGMGSNTSITVLFKNLYLVINSPCE